MSLDLRLAIPICCAFAGPGVDAQDDLLDRLGDARLSGPAMHELLEVSCEEAVEKLIAAYAATPNSQAGHIQRRVAALAMAEIAARRGEVVVDVIPELATSLDETDDPRRIEGALVALGAMVPHCADRSVGDLAIRTAEEHVPRLLLATEQRWTAGEVSTPVIEGFRAVAGMQVSWQTSPDRLAEMLRGPDPMMRECAATRLARHGEAALPVLREALRDRHPSLARGARIHVEIDGDQIVPIAAARSIARIDPTDRDAVGGLFWFAHYGLGQQRLSAVAALGNRRLGDRARVVSVLMTIALGRDERLAIEAITALGALGPSAQRSIGLLERFVAEATAQRSSLGKPAAAALQRIRPRRDG